jgi:Glycosyl hydrolase family 3 C terminal domain.
LHACRSTLEDPPRLLWSMPGADHLAEALRVAGKADVIVLVLGLTPTVEGEEIAIEIEGFRGGDRTEIGLPAPQEELLRKVCALGKPTVLVLMGGSALAVTWAAENVPAILEAWYPGQAGGDAIADVLFGDYNPAGRLPVTFYRSTEDLPPFTDYRMAGRTYRYFRGEPLFPFGYGLSYTRFAYSNLRLSADRITLDNTAMDAPALTVSVDVQNTGGRAR